MSEPESSKGGVEVSEEEILLAARVAGYDHPDQLKRRQAIRSLLIQNDRLRRIEEAAKEAERTIVNCRAVIMTLEKKPSMASLVIPAIMTETEKVLNEHLRPALSVSAGRARMSEPDG